MSGSEEKREPTYYGKMIPVHVEIETTQVVLAQPEMRELLSSTELIAVGECGCRRDAKACDHPLEVCLAVDGEAREEIAEHGWRAIGIDEALQILETTHRAGLVHVAYRKRNAPITLVCSCCSCACNPLRRLRRSGYRDEITQSAYVACFDNSACAGCGTCVERCPFGAFAFAESGQVEFRQSSCFGCGLCVSTCAAGAIEFVRR